MTRRPLTTRRQVLTAAGALVALPIATSEAAHAAPTPTAKDEKAAEAPACLADLVRTGVVTHGDFVAR